MFTSKINNVKKINIIFSVQQYAVLLAGSSRTVLHQSHINMLNLTVVLDRHTCGFLSLFWIRAKPQQTQKVQFIKQQ